MSITPNWPAAWRYVPASFCIILIGITWPCDSAYAHGQIEELALAARPNTPGYKIKVAHCQSGSGDQKLTMGLYGKGKLLHQQTISCEQAGLTSRVSISLFPQPLGPVVLIHTGAGRDGTEVMYYGIDARQNRLIHLGTMPQLQADAQHPGSYFYTQSSTGDYQSVRYNFEALANGFRFVSALGFAPCPAQDDCALLVPLNGPSLTALRPTGIGTQLTGPALVACQMGTGACP